MAWSCRCSGYGLLDEFMESIRRLFADLRSYGQSESTLKPSTTSARRICQQSQTNEEGGAGIVVC